MDLVPAGAGKFMGTTFRLMDVYFEFQYDDEGNANVLRARFGFRKDRAERSE
jgi:hypothetical protein